MRFEIKNTREDMKNPNLKIRICTVAYVYDSDISSDSEGFPDNSDYFTVTNRFGPQYALSTTEDRSIIIDSGASRCMFGDEG